MNILITDYDCICAAGTGMDGLRQSISEQLSGLRPNDIPRSGIPTWIGEVHGLDEIDLGIWQSRNNVLAQRGLDQGTLSRSIENAIDRFGAPRVGIVMGSSTASIDRIEKAFRELDVEDVLTPAHHQPNVHNPHAPGLFVAHATGATGPCMTINTACSSSARVFSTAARWLQLGLVDAALVGGVDTLCLSVLHGFHSLQLVSENPCKPFDRDRNGINLGEGAGYALLVRDEDVTGADRSKAVVLRGYGESSDAHHMSHPHPDGLGAEIAITDALERAGLDAADIDYINLHGTASRANDEIEGKLIHKLFPQSTCCSSTKGWTGHTLGAAGIIESIIALDSIQTGQIPGNLNLDTLDPGLSINISPDNREREVRKVMSNSFGFGGNNCSLVFSRVD